LIDQLCLVNPVDALLHWTSPEKTDFIPSDRIPQWNVERISVSERPLKPRFFILSTFVEFGRAPQVERLLNKWNYMDQIHETSHDGQTLLMAACITGQTDIVALLCDNGVNVNHADALRWTALHYAASYCHLQIVEKLLNRSALINAKTSQGYTPLDVVNRGPLVPGRREARSLIQQLLRGRR
jgi:hypothetical protein